MQEALNDLLYDEFASYFLIAGVFIVLAVVEWARWMTDAKPNPWLYSIIAICYSIFAAYKVRKALKKAKSLKLGRDGERAVGQYLEHLRETGAKVFHDIPGENFNLDHVVIHTTGIYVIETKTYSKPNSGSPKIVYDGNTVKLLGREPDRNPITQVLASSSWLTQLLRESCGKGCTARPVVVFPGWFVEPTAEAKQSDVWVLNPKALPSFINNSKKILTAEDVNLFSFHLSRYVRSS